jgi:hypothetical protein
MSEPFKLITGGVESQEKAASNLYIALQGVLDDHQDVPILTCLGIIEVMRAQMLADIMSPDGD